MSEWLDLCYTDGGIMVARQRIPKRPVLVGQMMDEWMKHYRRMWYDILSITFITKQPNKFTSNKINLLILIFWGLFCSSEGPQSGYLRQATTVSVCYSSDGESEND